MPKSYRMVGPDGSKYMIPESTVKQASSDGFRFDAGVTAPVPPALKGFVDSPYLGAARDTVGSLLGGAVSGITNTGRNLVNLGMSAASGSTGGRIKSTPITKGAGSTPTQDEMPAYIGEQAAEFLAPSMLMGKAAKAIQGAKALENVPALAKVIGFGARVGGEALATGSVNAAQGRDFSEGAKVGAASTIGGEALGYGLKKIGGPILDAALNISGAKLNKIGSPAQFMFDTGGFGTSARSAEAMRDFSNVKAKQVYNQVADLTANSPTRVNLQGMRDTGTGWMDQFMRQQNPNLVSQGNAVMDTANNVTLNIMGQPMTVSRNAQVPMTAAMDVRRGLAQVRPQNVNPFFEPQVNSMRDQMYGQLNEAMRQVHPELRDLDRQYANYATIGDSFNRKSSMWPSLVAGVGGLAGGTAHGGLGEGLLGAVAPLAAYHGLTSAPAGYAMGRLGAGAPTLFNAGKNAFLASDVQGTNPQ